jgi:histidine phosphotransfer protein HptB
MTEPAQIAERLSVARAAADAEPAFEPGAFQALVREIGDEGAAEVREVFMQETAARLRSFRAMSLGAQSGKIGREAHSLKSAAASFGYLRLSALARRLESGAARLTEPEYLDLLTAMDAAFASAMAHEARS